MLLLNPTVKNDQSTQKREIVDEGTCGIEG
jgi:hypothetical protein